MNKEFFIGRQSILDRDENIYAYEMLFRSADIGVANVEDSVAATSTVMINIMQNFGLDKLLGNKKGFINIDEDIIAEDVIDIIPKDRFVLEILEYVKMSDKLYQKIMDYKKEGYIFALDDFVLDKEYLENFKCLFDKVEIIKVDLMGVDRNALARKMEILKRLPVKLLAEKVESREEFEFCKEIGFDYFQGYYFAKPSVVKKTSVEPSKIAVIKVINLLRKDASPAEIEEALKDFPELNLNLLKFINSSMFFLKSTVSSLKHAINLLGRTNLSKWLTLLLYAGSDIDKAEDNPLMQGVLVRAKTMEKLAKIIFNESDKNQSEKAYLVGLMSMLDAVFNKPLEDFIDEFNLDEDIIDALLQNAGKLGKLLMLLKKLDSYNLEGYNELLLDLGITNDDLREARLNAFSEAASVV